MYKVAVCGLRHGHICSIIGQINKHPEMQVVAVAEEDVYEGKKILRDMDLKISHKNVDELLTDVNFDILAVGDVYAKRGEEVVKGLRAEKHILSDKPLCTRIEELEQIAEIATQKNLSVMAALDLRCNAAVQTAGKLIQSGEIGKIATVSIFGVHPLAFRSGRPDWYFQEGLHGGTINDLMIHGVDALNWITGYPVAEVIAARAWNFEIPEKPFFQDAAQGLLRLGNGAGVIFDVSYKAAQGHPAPWSFHFWGTGGEIIFTTSCKDIVVRRHNQPEKKIPAQGIESDFAQIVLSEIKQESGEKILTTKDCINSTRQTLRIQQAADLSETNIKI